MNHAAAQASVILRLVKAPMPVTAGRDFDVVSASTWQSRQVIRRLSNFSRLRGRNNVCAMPSATFLTEVSKSDKWRGSC